MNGFSRRKMLIAGGGALGALAWTWSPSGSVARAGTGTDPRWVWDAEADPLVAALLDRGDVPRVNELLRTWTRNDQPLPAGLPDDLHAFIERARRLPAWADPAKLERAAAFTQVKGPYLLLGYGLGSGMMSTAIPGEARAVYYSKGGADIRDRIAKTTKLGIDLHELNAFHPDGHIIVTAVKTRLVHAAVRHLLPQSPGWARTGGGRIPISQHEILVTWHSLPTFVMRRLAEWRVPVSAAESAAFLHLWQVNAHLLGVPDEYIPATWEAAQAQSRQILDPVMGPTPEGVSLADTLLTMASQAAGPGQPIARDLLNALTRYVAGDRVADWVQVPREPVWDPLIRTGFPQFVALREKLVPLPLLPPIAWTLDEVVRRLMMFYLSEGKPVDIVIPETNRPG
ncbi:oxygenase MpaB family protein [Amycolatopsis sp. NEAU-NG30]|uniref:Oxygenase MpaB family protein n=1 Tax=Amycolatopsis melonis TaxID=3156488 RepID=A0ABV0LC23_9PSEU